MLAKLEAGEQGGAVADLASDLPLFAAAARPKGGAAEARASAPSPLDDALRGINPDELTPRDALDALYRLRAMLNDKA